MLPILQVLQGSPRLLRPNSHFDLKGVNPSAFPKEVQTPYLGRVFGKWGCMVISGLVTMALWGWSVSRSKVVGVPISLLLLSRTSSYTIVPGYGLRGSFPFQVVRNLKYLQR